MRYEVFYTYDEPRYDSIVTDADTAEEAEELAVQELKRTYPEVEEFVVEEVREVNGRDN